MPDPSRRWSTRLREDFQAARGSIDRLCGNRAMLSPHPSWGSWFVAACREYLAEALLDPAHSRAREACLREGWLPRRLRHACDLKTVPSEAWVAPLDSLRRQRRQARVLENMLTDLGWSRSRQRHSKCLPIAWQSGLPLARCELGQWHLPRVVAPLGERWISPVFQLADACLEPGTDGSEIGNPVQAGCRCACGRNLGLLS